MTVPRLSGALRDILIDAMDSIRAEDLTYKPIFEYGETVFDAFVIAVGGQRIYLKESDAGYSIVYQPDSKTSYRFAVDTEVSFLSLLFDLFQTNTNT